MKQSRLIKFLIWLHGGGVGGSGGVSGGAISADKHPLLYGVVPPIHPLELFPQHYPINVMRSLSGPDCVLCVTRPPNIPFPTPLILHAHKHILDKKLT